MGPGQLLDQAWQCIAARAWTQAIGRLMAILHTDPHRIDVTALLVRCHLAVGEYPQARTLARAGLRLAGSGPAAGECRQLLARCGDTTTDGLVATARSALQRREFDRAARLLERLVGILPGDALLADALTYARGRERGTEVSQAALDRVVEWLNRNRLAAVTRALPAGDLKTAYDVTTAVLRYDRRGTRAACLQAYVLCLRVSAIQPGGVDDAVLDGARHNLRTATALMHRAAGSAGLVAHVRDLGYRIDVLTRQVDQLRCAHGVAQLTTRDEGFATRFPPGEHSVTRYDADRVLRWLAALITDLDAHLATCPTDSPDHHVLRGIRARAARTHRGLARSMRS